MHSIEGGGQRSPERQNLKADSVTPEKQGISRRTFLKNAFYGIAVVNATRNAIENDHKTGYGTTAKETGYMTAAELAAQTVLEVLKIPSGATGGAKEVVQLVKENPAKCFFEAVVKGPIVEEALCRAAPSDMLIPKSDKSQRWDIGTITSLAFGLGHNLDRGEDGKLVFRKSLPLTQTLGGAFHWYLMT
jgi:hypothetical protein